MAITATSSPITLNATGRPIKYVFSTDRLTTGANYTSVTVATDGGGSPKCRYTKNSHGVQVGDVILPTLFDAYYNVVQTVTAVATNTFDTDLAWSSKADTSGTVTIVNNNYRLKVEVYSYVDGTLGYLYRDLVSSLFTFDVSQLLNDTISYTLPNIIDIYRAQTTLTNQYRKFKVYATETFNDASGNYKEITGTKYTGTDKYAIKATRGHLETQSLTGYQLSSGSSLFLTNAPRGGKVAIRSNEQFDLAFFADNITTYKIAIAGDHSGSSIITGYSNDIMSFVHVNSNMFDSSDTVLYVQIQNGSGTNISENFQFTIDRKNYPYYKRLMWRNRFGAWDSFTFTYDYEEVQESEKMNFNKFIGSGFAKTDRGLTTYSVKTITRCKAVSKYIDITTAAWLKELESSDEVYLIDVATSTTQLIPVINVVVDCPLIYNENGLIRATVEYDLPDVI